MSEKGPKGWIQTHGWVQVGQCDEVYELVCFASNGRVAKVRPYTRLERIIRRVGALLRVHRVARYHEQYPIGAIRRGT